MDNRCEYPFVYPTSLATTWDANAVQVEPLCRSAKNSSDFALDEYDDLQESLTGDIFPVRGYFGRIVRGPSISGHIIATLSQLAADMEQLCAMQVGSGSTQAERNDRFRNVTQWYLKVGEVFTEDDETEYGVLTRSFMIMRERLDVIADGAMRSVDIVQESLLPWAVARNETLASILRLMSGRSKWSRDPGTIEDLKWLVTYGAKAAAGIKRTLPMAAAVQRAAVEARDALEEMWQAARSVLLFLETAREEGWMEEKEVCGRVMRRTLVVDPGGVSSAAYRLEAEFIDRVNYMMMEQRKRERIDAFDPRVGG